jgi:hypothetical protein
MKLRGAARDWLQMMAEKQLIEAEHEKHLSQCRYHALVSATKTDPRELVTTETRMEELAEIHRAKMYFEKCEKIAVFMQNVVESLKGKS